MWHRLIKKKREARLRRFGYVLSKPPSTDAHITYYSEIEGMRARHRSKQRWRDSIKHDMREHHLNSIGAHHQNKWRSKIRKAEPLSAGKR